MTYQPRHLIAEQARQRQSAKPLRKHLPTKPYPYRPLPISERFWRELEVMKARRMERVLV